MKNFKIPNIFRRYFLNFKKWDFNFYLSTRNSKISSLPHLLSLSFLLEVYYYLATAARHPLTATHCPPMTANYCHRPLATAYRQLPTPHHHQCPPATATHHPSVIADHPLATADRLVTPATIDCPRQLSLAVLNQSLKENII